MNAWNAVRHWADTLAAALVRGALIHATLACGPAAGATSGEPLVR